MTVLGKLADQCHRLLDATHISATEHLQIVHECYIEELLIIKTRFCSDSQQRLNSFAVNYLKYTRLLLTVVGFDHEGFTGIFTEWRRGKTFNPQVNLGE